MMRQYLEIKEQHQDAILFFRLGDFYEMFFDDAVKASKILDIALTSRNKSQEGSVPLCGIPYHSAGQYIRKLLEEGCKVAICDQVEDPKQAKGIVRREVIRVMTPGLRVEDEATASQEGNFLGAFAAEDQGWILVLLDLSTGEILMGFYESRSAVLQEATKHPLRELLVFPGESHSNLAEELKKNLPRLLLSQGSWEEGDSEPPEHCFSQELREAWRALPTLESRRLLTATLAYIAKTQKSELKHLGVPVLLRARQYLGLDEGTVRHLELVKNQRGEGRRGTLFSVLDQTRTSMGSRRLSRWILYPLVELEAIEARLDAVQELSEHPDLCRQLQEGLREIQDVERMLGKLALGTVNGRDLRQLGLSLAAAARLCSCLREKFQASLLATTLHEIPDLSDLSQLLLERLVEEPPHSVREGGVIAEGVHGELDELRHLSRDGKSVIAAMELKERARTGISSLKVRFNRVFGYYIEITHTHRENIPSDYIRKQTLANAERFITPQLKEYEEKVLSAEERIKNLEYELFCVLRESAGQKVGSLRLLAQGLGTLDALAALGQVARENRYVRPQLSSDSVLELEESRHPVLEKLPGESRFIPNDLCLGSDSQRLFLITGPNMAGKSTLMRQVALAVVMAHMGSFVPARRACIGLADQVFTRIGASDDLSRGQSTFMVEMLETAHILTSATSRSFIVMDEIGRGTSTYDGMSIAWAVAEFVAQQLKCRALFATHYHELTELASQVEGVANYQVAVKEWNGQILFLHKLVPGGASRSYGIEVARLSGLPNEVLGRAREVLGRLENIEGSALHTLNSGRGGSVQGELFASRMEKSPAEAEVLERLACLQPETLSPLEALSLLFEIKKSL